MARMTQEQKQTQKSIQTDIKDMVLGNNPRDEEVAGGTEPEADVAGDSSPRGEDEESGRLADGTSEDKHVPYARFQEVNEQHKATQGELDKAQKELAALKKSAERMKPYEQDARLEALLEEKPDGWDKMPAERQLAYLADQAAQRQVAQTDLSPEDREEIAMQRAERALIKATGNRWNVQQMAVLLQLREEAPGLPGPDLVSVAKRRHSDLFKGVGTANDGLSSSHVVNVPGSEQEPEQSTKTARQKLDEEFVRTARARDKVGMKRALIDTIKDDIFTETTPRGRRR